MNYGFDWYSFGGFRQSETCGTLATGCGRLRGGTEVVVQLKPIKNNYG